MQSPHSRQDAAVRGLFKAILQLGAGLQTPRQLRNVLRDIYDKIVTPCRDRGLSRDDLAVMFEGILACGEEPGPARVPCYGRLVRGLMNIVLRWYR